MMQVIVKNKRVEEIILTAKKMSEDFADEHGFGPGVLGFIEKVLTKEEFKEVDVTWDKMPGHTCWMDAFFKWANVQPPFNYKV
jgi:hypothetical protein